MAGLACVDGDCGDEAITLQGAGEQDIQPIRSGMECGCRSFSSFKYHEGAAGQGYDWHHIVEQTPQEEQWRFGIDLIIQLNGGQYLIERYGRIHGR